MALNRTRMPTVASSRQFFDAADNVVSEDKWMQKRGSIFSLLLNGKKVKTTPTEDCSVLEFDNHHGYRVALRWILG